MRRSAVRERIDEIDELLFHAGILTLCATTKEHQTRADSKITEARAKLEKLRRKMGK